MVKIVQIMRIGEHIRQGDLLIMKVGEADPDKNYKQNDVIPDGILALGEATGHAHGVATKLDQIFSPSDLEFLEKQQELLGDAVASISAMKVLEGHPVVLKPKTSFWKFFSKIQDDEKDIIARIHSPVPFWVVHYNKKTAGVIPLDSRKIIGTDKLHRPIRLPAGFYEVIQQTEAVYTDKGAIQVRRVID